jgi:iron complex transport system substrate-binding protein
MSLSRRDFIKLFGLSFGSVAAGVSLSACSGDPSAKASKLEEALANNTGEAWSFTDSCGRTVALSNDIANVAPSGAYAQVMLLSLCPEKLMGLCSKISKTQLEFFGEQYADLPVFGRFYSRNADMNYEAIIDANPDMIIDVGEHKETIKEDLTSLQEQTGLPVVFVEAALNKMADAYTLLGEVTQTQSRAKELADYTNDILSFAKKVKKSKSKEQMPRILYGSGEYGTEVHEAGNIHAAVLDAVGVRNVAQLTNTNSNQVSIEQIMNWDPDIVILAPNSYFEDIYDDPSWSSVSAVKNKRVYEIPSIPYSWIDQPPSIQQLLGILWLGNLLYPKDYNFDMADKAAEFMKLYWNAEPGKDAINSMLANSTLIRK